MEWETEFDPYNVKNILQYYCHSDDYCGNFPGSWDLTIIPATEERIFEIKVNFWAGLSNIEYYSTLRDTSLEDAKNMAEMILNYFQSLSSHIFGFKNEI